ncbi:MAG: universal stress protein [Candidatus Nitrosocosmicus sp.]|nr:universal stress protein [Candidatus Nitrosocosmicus sp.]
MYSKILVPVDGSQNALRALSEGLFLASKLNSKLTILYVTEIPPFVYIQSQKIIDTILETLEDESKRILDEAESIAQNQDVNYEIVSLKGQSVGSTILEYEVKNNFDLIIIGSRGRGKIKSTILGSTSNYVFNHTKKPVLVVK